MAGIRKTIRPIMGFGYLAEAGGVTIYQPFATASVIGTHSSETTAQHSETGGFAVESFHIAVTQNTLGTAIPFTLRKNAANGNTVVTVPAGITGTFSYVGTEDSFSAGDLSAIKIVIAAGSGTLYLSSVAVLRFTSGDEYSAIRIGGSCRPTVTATRYYPLFQGGSTGSGFTGFTTFSSSEQFVMRRAGSIRRLDMNATTNTRDAATTFSVYKNSAETALGVSIPASTTGAFLDSSDSISFEAGDVIGYITANAATAGDFYVRPTVEIKLNDGGMFMPFHADAVLTYNVGAAPVNYLPFSGTWMNDGYDQFWTHFSPQIRVINSKVCLVVSTNTISVSRTLTSTNGSSTGNISIAVPATTTGTFTDLVNSDTILEGVRYSYKITGELTNQMGILHLSSIFDYLPSTFDIYLDSGVSGFNIELSPDVPGSPSLSPSSSVSPSTVGSASLSPSSSASPSSSVSPSLSPSSSVSPSLSPSSSGSPSLSPSSSVSPSLSPSSSRSPSLSPSSSVSPSLSPSASLSPSSSSSPSLSPSSSVSPSLSPSSSVSPSLSPSSSVSPSLSPSASLSPSSSASPSTSPSRSPSLSPSSSVSPSPSPGWSVYSRTATGSLPTDDADLATVYSGAEETTVSTNDGSRVDQAATAQYAIHEFKDYVGALTGVTLTWEGQTDYAPASATVYLQIYNYNTTTWDTVDSDNSSAVSTDFTLTAIVSPLTNYVSSGTITCRVYQLMP